MKTIRIKADLSWKWGISSKKKYIAVCASLAQTIQAETFNDLLLSIHEALDSTFKELLSTGDLSKFLSERGWKTEKPVVKNGGRVSFDVPFDVKRANSRDLQALLC